MCLVTVQGEGKFEMTQSKYRLTEEQKHDDGAKLFDFCAESLKTFIDTNSAPDVGAIRPDAELSLGFTVRAVCMIYLDDADSIVVFLSLLVSPR